MQIVVETKQPKELPRIFREITQGIKSGARRGAVCHADGCIVSEWGVYDYLNELPSLNTENRTLNTL